MQELARQTMLTDDGPSRTQIALCVKKLLALEARINAWKKQPQKVASGRKALKEFCFAFNISQANEQKQKAEWEDTIELLEKITNLSRAGKSALHGLVGHIKTLASLHPTNAKNYYRALVDDKGTFHLWCFSPGVAVTELTRLKVRSIIMTSGTLSPLDAFARQLTVPFPIHLENPHVVGHDKVWVGVVPKGPTGFRLNSSYEHRSNPRYMSELGRTLVNLCRMAPDGVLVFFPSYGVMSACVQAWKNSDVWDRMSQRKGKIVVEPRSAQEMKTCIQQYEQAVDRGIGAMFMAVCRGKASEGRWSLLSV